MTFRLGALLKSLTSDVKRVASSAETLVSEGTHAAKEVAVRTGNSALAALGVRHQDQFATGKLADPAVTAATLGNEAIAQNVIAQPATGRLFVDGATEGDVQQGMIGDCYFLAALAAVARTKPGFLEQHLVRNEDGTVTATFYENGQKIPVTVDADLPRLNVPLARHVDLLASSSNPNELWPSLYEKAFATWKGSYDAIGDGGYPAAALRALTGMEPRYAPISPGYTQPAELGAQLRRVVDAKLPMTAASRTGALPPGLEGIVPHHIYTVDKVEQRGAEWYVTLRNPWGTGEPISGGLSEGTFSMKMTDFMRAFSDVAWVE